MNSERLAGCPSIGIHWSNSESLWVGAEHTHHDSERPSRDTPSERPDGVSLVPCTGYSPISRLTVQPQWDGRTVSRFQSGGTLTATIHEMAEIRRRRDEYEQQRRRAAAALHVASVEFRKLQALERRR